MIRGRHIHINIYGLEFIFTYMNLSSTSHRDGYTPDYMLSCRRHGVVEIMLRHMESYGLRIIFLINHNCCRYSRINRLS